MPTSQVLRAFHGANGNKIVGIMNAGGFMPKNGRVYLSKLLDTFQYGVDSRRKASFTVLVEVPGPVSVTLRNPPGNPQTLEISSLGLVRARVLSLVVRAKHPWRGFSLSIISSENAIRAFLK